MLESDQMGEALLWFPFTLPIARIVFSCRDESYPFVLRH